ncbi:LEAF RUST 10 DISEASE-RESISTANCE LOCUS RECEPTOR-LIKE PROTEIN KINASE-like 1.1 [Bidens hawaiensis]|uniref:LEAF RUST 10 DISEASE-RESISTANCE LOCUS RECEPTOR-LIKE PROTEIN KINASE-like 1.1 n=1 Tax=Bidens hawaiensis TaxID=980011 RepID=UPI00404B5B5F
MTRIFFFMYVMFSCLPPLHSTTNRNNSMPICPKGFSCPELTSFKYPFYNVTDTRCGLIKVHCTSKGGEIQIGGQLYEIVDKFETDNIVIISNRTFEHLVENKRCEALMNNITSPSPSPLLYSISVFPLITLFKCTKNLNYAQLTDAYFEKHNYKSYNKCNYHNFYYNFLNETVPSGLPHTCQVVHLPVKLSSTPRLDEANIFSLLSHVTSIEFKLSHSCHICHTKGGQCHNENGHFQCLNAKKVIVGSVFILILSFVIFIVWHRCKNNPFSYVSAKKKSPNLDDISLSCGVSVFSYKELEDATENFDPSRKLGDGGFGAVYYGKLQDGREVAVKKLHEHNYNRVEQFRNEVEILTKLRHPNLVVLYGCTSRQSRELLLVYEYISNGTVADHLHGEQANPDMLTWPIRMNIAIETASALEYLHASEIIHRDVKTTNILLDNNFCVKVADFGLSRLISNNVTHVSTAPQGTPGYVDPQYHQHYQLTDKSDVYSFGVVLIELISSKVAVDLNRSKDEISLANLALKKIQRCAIDEIIDPVLGSSMNLKFMNMITLVAELAFRCLQYDSDMRPTMNEVFDVLMDIQAVDRIGACDNIIDLQTMKVSPFTETNDRVVLLKDFLRSPVSVASEWKSDNSASTTLSSKGDRLSMKNDTNT